MIEPDNSNLRQTKAEQTRDWLEHEIRIGNFTRGAALPSERVLADQVGVSYMTLRKAVGALVKDGLLERNHGSGTFVRSEIPEQKLQRVLGLVMPAWSAPENQDTVMYFSQACEAEGWLLKVVYVRGWEDRSIFDLYHSCDALSMMLVQAATQVPLYLREELRSATKPVVITGESADFIGKDSVFYRNDWQMKKPCERLYELGHSRIILVDQLIRQQGKLTTIHSSLKGIENFFRQEFPEVEYNSKLMSLEIPLFLHPHQYIRQTIRRKRKELIHYTAVVCPLSFYWAVMSGLRDIGMRVPEDMSVLTFGDRQEAEFYLPRPAVFSVLLKDQAYQTLKQVIWRLANPSEAPVIIQTAVQFVEGDTLAPARKKSYAI